VQEEIEKEIKRRETVAVVSPGGRRPPAEPDARRRLGSCNRSRSALELRDVRKSFGKTEIIRGRQPGGAPRASAWR
jgi:hypothetical protein